MRLDLDSLMHSGWREVCGFIGKAAHRVLFVGGCVRDAILGRLISDVDLATSADANEILELAAAAGLRTVPTGLKYGSVSVYARARCFTVTSFRKDLESDGRHPSIAHSNDIIDDAMRRDFTMNALYASPDGEVLDPLDGMDDLLAGRVRFIGEPRDRIREDYLRMLRFFRMHIYYGGVRAELDPDGLEAVRELADGVEQLSRERIGAEMIRMLEARDPSCGLLPMERTGLLSRILPGSTAAVLPMLEKLEHEFNLPPDPLRRLALFGGDNAASSLRLSRKCAKHVETLFRNKSVKETPSATGYRLGERLAIDALLLRAAETGEALETDFQATVANAAGRVFPLSAADLMPKYTGVALGRKLAELEQAWIEDEFSSDRCALMLAAKAADVSLPKFGQEPHGTETNAASGGRSRETSLPDRSRLEARRSS